MVDAQSRTSRTRWLLLAVISAIYFTISAATFSSLGIVLPSMIRELGWSWSQAGTGFSLLALLVGVASALPAWTIRSFGITGTYVLGGLIMVAGFCLLGMSSAITSYWLATALLGLGFALCAIVPGIYLVNGWMAESRSTALGVYMTIGGLGAVAGPLAANAFLAAAHAWRPYWWVVAGLMLVLTVLASIFVKTPPAAASAPAGGPEGKTPASDWRFREAIRTPQYWIISLAMTGTLLCVLTTSSFAPAHLSTLGVPAALAATVLSTNGAVGAISRYVGGALANRVDPKWLLVAGLAGEALSMLSLSLASHPVALAVFAVTEGFGFGMCLLATALLLVNYFGPADNPAIFGTFNLITTVAMIGPYVGGLVKDLLGGFGALFQGNALLMSLILVLAAFMHPPRGTAP
jgi:predicted MFS family arabinose efflux permease